MNDILLVTTPSVEGAKIEHYLGVINSNQVSGTDYFTDFIASLSDIVGGNSGAYRKAMNNLCGDAMELFKERALDRGANAIVGVRIDFDNISAKGMSMFMVSLQGTAVKLSYNEGFSAQESVNDEVLWDTLSHEVSKRTIKRKLTEDVRLTEQDWEFLLENPCSELLEPLYQYFAKIYSYCRLHPEANIEPYKWGVVENYKRFVYTLPYSIAIEYVYRDLEFFKDIIEKNRLFNASKILEIAKQGDLSLVISLLNTSKSSYSKIDLEEILTLKDYLNSLPKKGIIGFVDGGLFSSGGQKFICTCGKKNDINTEFCDQCGKNIYGITKEEKLSIERFNDLADALEEILSNK